MRKWDSSGVTAMTLVVGWQIALMRSPLLRRSTGDKLIRETRRETRRNLVDHLRANPRGMFVLASLGGISGGG